MTYPVGVATATVTFGPYEGTGSVVFTATPLVWSATGAVILTDPLTEVLDYLGSGSIVLPVDQAGFTNGSSSVRDWTYQAIIRRDGHAADVRTFALPEAYAGTTVDLDLLTSVASSSGTEVALPQVISVDGEVGVVDTDAVTAARVTDTETATGAALAGRFAPRPSNTFGVLGDSITAFGSATGSTYTSTNAKGYWAWANIILRHRLQLVKMAGVSGDSTTQMLARIDDYLDGGVPGWSFVLGGANDANGLVSLATITANLTAIYDAIEAAGGRVVAVTVPPRTSASAAVSLRIAEVNRWLKQQGATRAGLTVVDVYPALVAASSGDYGTGMSGDGVHPAPLGAAIMGRAFAAALDSLVPRLDVLPYGAVDTVNLITNALMNGTGGTAGAGGSGSVATGWQVNPIDGVASVYVCSKVARTDGFAGEWQQVAVTSGQVKINFNVTGFGTVYNTGDQVYAVCEFETDTDLASATGNYFRLKMAATKPDFGDGFAGYDLDNNADTVWPAATYVPRSGVLVTEPITVPATATLRLAFELQRKGAGTIRVARCGIYKVGAGGPIW